MDKKFQRLLLRIAEAGEIAGCGRSTAFEMVAKGEWETVDTPYGRRVVAESLEQWIEEKRAGK